MPVLHRARTIAVLALTSAMVLVTGFASAEPPAPQPPASASPPAPQVPPPGATSSLPGLAPGAPGADAPANAPAEKSSLIKELPIASYVLAPLTAAGGAALNVFGTNAVNDLKDPAKHTTPDQTHSLVVRAR